MKNKKNNNLKRNIIIYVIYITYMFFWKREKKERKSATGTLKALQCVVKNNH